LFSRHGRKKAAGWDEDIQGRILSPHLMMLDGSLIAIGRQAVGERMFRACRFDDCKGMDAFYLQRRNAWR